MPNVSIKEALQRVADNPRPVTDEVIQLPVHELVCRNLFEIANNPDASVRGSMTRANTARKMILDRMVGKRRAGSHPATRTPVDLEFVDLTGGALDEGTPGDDEPAAGVPGGDDPSAAPVGGSDRELRGM